MNTDEKEEIKENDFKNGRGGDKKGCIGERGEESDTLKKDHREKVIEGDQEGGQWIEGKGEERGDEAERDDEETHPRNGKKVGE